MDASLTRLSFADLPGWKEHDFGGVLAAFRLSCREMLEQGSGFSRPVRFGGSPSSWRTACLTAFEEDAAKEYFEARFRAYRVNDSARPDGLFTGYYEPEVDGSRTSTAEYPVPIYRTPPDLMTFGEDVRTRAGLSYGRLVGGVPQPYLTRRDIEQGALAGLGLEIVWLKDWADAFFLHIQGSGRVRLADGGTIRLSYAAKSGLPYTAIGGVLVERGLLRPERMSMQAIRNWLAMHPVEARLLMWQNESFVFFREIDLEDPDLGALGAQHVQLTPRRSLAIDRSFWMFGTPVWLDTKVTNADEHRMDLFRQLLVAQDTGSAIRGLARGDVYWGFGHDAGRIAGPMKSPGTMTVLLPHEVADELGLTA